MIILVREIGSVNAFVAASCGYKKRRPPRPRAMAAGAAGREEEDDAAWKREWKSAPGVRVARRRTSAYQRLVSDNDTNRPTAEAFCESQELVPLMTTGGARSNRFCALKASTVPPKP